MSRNEAYQIPGGTVRTEFKVKRSRFIATVGRASSKQDALDFIASIRSAYPDANQHCWAYIIGNPLDLV